MQSIIKKSVLGALAGAALMAVAGLASAACTPASDTVAYNCALEYSALNQAILDANISPRDEASLLAKCDDSILKANRFKLDDSAQKLNDIVAKVTAPTFKGDAGTIVMTAQATAACILGLK